MSLSEHDNELDTPPTASGHQTVQPMLFAVAPEETHTFDTEITEAIDVNLGSQNVLGSSIIPQSQEQTRARIALMFSQVFLWLVIAVVVLPLVIRITRPELIPDPVSTIKELSTTIAAILAGPFGFIVGFYFKKGSEE